MFHINIKDEGVLSEFDCWLQQKKKSGSGADRQTMDICQTISVQEDGDFALLQTRLPTEFIGEQPIAFDLIERKTKTYYQSIGNHPYLSYNLGSSKIIIQNTLRVGAKKTFILEMQDGDEFISFVKFNKFEDIGLFAEDLRIECCSHIAFITQNDELEERNGPYQGNRLNVILLDPFYEVF